MNVTIIETGYYHMPDRAKSPELAGQTIRQAIKTLRGIGRRNFGDIGEMVSQVGDNTELVVRLESTDGQGTRLMSSQRIERCDSMTGQVIRRYPW